MSERIRIGILEDQQVFRESLVAIFENAGMDVVAKGAEAEGFLAQLEGPGPDVALVDLRLDRMDGGEVGSGLKVVETLRARHPNTRALVLSAHRDPSTLTRCFQAGASGYLCKLNVSCAELLSAVTSVARGERLAPPELGTPVSGEQRVTLDRLTQREREVLGLVAGGADNLQISAKLGITERTVKAHVSNLYRKLGVQNRVEMAVMAYQAGMPLPADDHVA